ncbi:hypothetical protein JCM8097_003026 [Rhodosporidiobolus ruineniae]
MATTTQSGTERARFLEHLVYQQFGSAVGEIASIFLSRGALSFPQLIKLTSLPPSTTHAALLVLSTHLLLVHSETEVNGRITELFELNHHAVERRVRGGMYAQMADEWDELGPGLAEVVQAVWSEGMLPKEDLVAVAANRVAAEHGVDVHGLDLEDPKGKKRARAEEQCQSTASRLLRRAFARGFLSIVTPGSQISPSSLEIKWEEELRLTIKGIPTTKDLQRVKKLLREKQDEFAEEERERAKGKGSNRDEDYPALPSRTGTNGAGSDSDSDAPKRKKRRKVNGKEDAKGKKGGKGRKKKVESSSDEGSEDEDELRGEKEDPALPDEAFFKINEERFHIRWRAQLLRNFARELYNPHVATVLGVILDIVSQETELMTEGSSRAVSLHEINTMFERLPSHLKPDLSQTFAKHKLDASWPPKALSGSSKSSSAAASKSAGPYILAICEVLSGQDQWGMSTREMFLLQQGEGTHAKWAVSWTTLGRAMKRQLVEAVIKEKLGQTAIRCWRIMEAKGKLDEKHLARLAFLSVKDAREVLGRLSSSGFIEPQEVPRSADRNPSRTLYLWFVDFNKVTSSLVDHFYKALGNVQAQRQEQLEKRRGLVEKRERTDVRENEALLTARDRESIHELDQTLEALAVAEQRIDEQLFVLREFDPEPEQI